MAESNDNWECLGTVNLVLEDDKQFNYTFFLYMKIIGGRPFYHIKKKEEPRPHWHCRETTVSKYTDNNSYNAFVDIKLSVWNGTWEPDRCYRCYLNVPTWDKL